MPELVTGDAGRLVDVPDDWTGDHGPDPDRMAEAVDEIMARPGEFARAARKRAEASFDREQWVDRHAEIFTSLLSR
jgi:glycosyltransferase involved in cell wall biosynthesis